LIVSSQSLATYLEQKVPDAALNVGTLQVPQCDPGFRPSTNIYVDFGISGTARLFFHLIPPMPDRGKRQLKQDALKPRTIESNGPVRNGADRMFKTCSHTLDRSSRV
jgi:hypothetical protein